MRKPQLANEQWANYLSPTQWAKTQRLRGQPRGFLQIQTWNFFPFFDHSDEDCGAGLIKRKLEFASEVWNLNQSLFLNRCCCTPDKYFSSRDKRGLRKSGFKRKGSDCMQRKEKSTKYVKTKRPKPPVGGAVDISPDRWSLQVKTDMYHHTLSSHSLSPRIYSPFFLTTGAPLMMDDAFMEDAERRIMRTDRSG